MKQKQESYQRFYKAVTTCWVFIEELWVTRTQSYRDAEDFDDAMGYAIAKWVDNPMRSLSEKIDIMEAVEFVWGFLGRKTFDDVTFYDWLGGQGAQELMDRLEDAEEEGWAFGYFLDHLFQYLRPGHIIELLLWMWSDSKWGLNKPKFLQRLGMFDHMDGILDDGSSPTVCNWISMDEVREDVPSSLAKLPEGTTLIAQWQEYASKKWKVEARGRIFLGSAVTAENLFSLIATPNPK